MTFMERRHPATVIARRAHASLKTTRIWSGGVPPPRLAAHGAWTPLQPSRRRHTSVRSALPCVTDLTVIAAGLPHGVPTSRNQRNPAMTRPLLALLFMVFAIYGALAVGAGAAHLRAASTPASVSDEAPERIARLFTLPSF